MTNVINRSMRAVSDQDHPTAVVRARRRAPLADASVVSLAPWDRY